MMINKAMALGLSLIALAGCGGTGTSETTGPPAAAVPASLFVTVAPEGAVPLVDVKSAKPGDRVVFEARVGGRRAPFIENRAVFFVADPALPSCADLGDDDECRTPWDYCCETPDSKLLNMATVQVVDASGQPLKTSLENENGLAPLKTIFVTGIVHESGEAGNFVVNADAIYVKEG